jgi:DNA-binding transcriptional ArsR family regulator
MRMRDEMFLETTQQIQAIAHPLRQRALNLLVDAPYTNKQLASVLQVSPPRLHFHMRELLEAGLVEIVEERPKGGILEKYYRSIARILRLSPQISQVADDAELLENTLDVVKQEYVRANAHFEGRPPDLSFLHLPIRLSPERLVRLKEHLKAIDDEILQAESDPQRDTYEGFFTLTYLFHALPPVVREENTQEVDEL